MAQVAEGLAGVGTLSQDNNGNISFWDGLQWKLAGQVDDLAQGQPVVQTETGTWVWTGFQWKFAGLTGSDDPPIGITVTFADVPGPPPTEDTAESLIAQGIIPGTAAPPTTTAAAKAAPLLTALGELQAVQEPGVQRRAFAPFAERGFGLSGLAGRGVKEALGEFEAEFAGERERIKATALERALEEQFQKEQIAALKGT